MADSPAWQRALGKNPEGGLNEAGRRSYNRSTGGNLKAPVSRKQAARSETSAARRKSKKLTSAKTARDPNSRINKSLRKWDC